MIVTRRSAANKSERDFGPTGAALIPQRMQSPNNPYVGPEQAMRQSAVWACLRLRADLMSSMPVDVYRMVQGKRIEVPKPQILVNPGGDRVSWQEWCYMSQVELDRSGNFIGIISQVDGNGKPVRIDAQASRNCSIIIQDGDLWGYRIHGTKYPRAQIWHEKQYPAAGEFVGLSPVMYAAFTLSEYESIRQFTTAWFSGGAVPRARLRNTERTFTDTEALMVKESWRGSINSGEPFVHGSDWEYDLMQAQEASSDWMEAKNSDTVDIARFFGCPADLIDAAIRGESITYANISQRNLQFLIMNLGPAIFRREVAFSTLVTDPRFVKLNTNAILRMTPTDRYAVYEKTRNLGVMTVNEIRQLEDLDPLPGGVGDIPIGESLLVGLSRGAAMIASGYAEFLEPAPQLAPTLPDGTSPSANNTGNPTEGN